MQRKKLAATREAVQYLKMPRRAVRMAEWIRAVPVNQGKMLAFSTGSHAQYPPQPSSTYAHSAPSTIPIVNTIQENIIQGRASRSHALFFCPVRSEPSKRAKGAVN